MFQVELPKPKGSLLTQQPKVGLWPSPPGEIPLNATVNSVGNAEVLQPPGSGHKAWKRAYSKR